MKKTATILSNNSFANKLKRSLALKLQKKQKKNDLQKYNGSKSLEATQQKNCAGKDILKKKKRVHTNCTKLRNNENFSFLVRYAHALVARLVLSDWYRTTFRHVRLGMQ